MMKSIELKESVPDTDYDNIALRYNNTEKNAVTL